MDPVTPKQAQASEGIDTEQDRYNLAEHQKYVSTYTGDQLKYYQQGATRAIEDGTGSAYHHALKRIMEQEIQRRKAGG